MNKMEAGVYDIMSSPLGEILLQRDEAGLRQVALPSASGSSRPSPAWRRDRQALEPARQQLEAYFAGELRSFELPLAVAGSDFARRVFACLAEIPFGHTVSYGQLARSLGRPTASRAVGAAVGSNPLAIVLPCHRVIGANGALTGYAGGLDAKRWLLRHEGVVHPDLFA